MSYPRDDLAVTMTIRINNCATAAAAAARLWGRKVKCRWRHTLLQSCINSTNDLVTCRDHAPLNSKSSAFFEFQVRHSNAEKQNFFLLFTPTKVLQSSRTKVKLYINDCRQKYVSRNHQKSLAVSLTSSACMTPGKLLENESSSDLHGTAMSVLNTD